MRNNSLREHNVCQLTRRLKSKIIATLTKLKKKESKSKLMHLLQRIAVLQQKAPNIFFNQQKESIIYIYKSMPSMFNLSQDRKNTDRNMRHHLYYTRSLYQRSFIPTLSDGLFFKLIDGQGFGMNVI